MSIIPLLSIIVPLSKAAASSLTCNENTSNNPITLNFTGGVAKTVAVASGPSHGTATPSGNAITYTPTTNFSGSDSFTFTANNQSGISSAATVTITVNVIVSPPTVGNTSTTVNENTSANPVTLSFGGGTPTHVTVTSGPSHGSTSVSGTNISYTPAANYFGSDSFTYTANNAGGTSGTATASLTINQVGAAITVGLDTVTITVKSTTTTRYAGFGNNGGIGGSSPTGYGSFSGTTTSGFAVASLYWFTGGSYTDFGTLDMQLVGNAGTGTRTVIVNGVNLGASGAGAYSSSSNVTSFTWGSSTMHNPFGSTSGTVLSCTIT